MAMNQKLLRPRASGVHPEAAAWRTAVVANGGSVSSTTLAAVNVFCKAVDSAGLRSLFYRLNLFCGGNLSSALVPLYRGQSKGGTQYGNSTDTNSNFVGGDYVETGVSGGLKGNGTNKRLNTGMAGTVLTSGNRHLGAYVIISPTTDYSPSVVSVSSNALQHAIGGWLSATDVTYRTHNAVGGQARISTGRSFGFWFGSDLSSTASTLYKNGVVAASTSAQNAGGSSPNNYGILGDTSGEWSEEALGGYSIGLSMTATQASNYYNAMQVFQTALTRNV